MESGRRRGEHEVTIATEGAHALLLALRRAGSVVALAAVVGCHANTLTRWVSGRAKPTYESRKTLLEKCGIGLSTWDVPLDKPYTVKVSVGVGRGYSGNTT